MRKKMLIDWKLTPAGQAKYMDRRAEAQSHANATGFDYGIEANDIFEDYTINMLPQRKNRRGSELRVEVVMCEKLEKCQPGHGPMAKP